VAVDVERQKRLLRLEHMTGGDLAAVDVGAV
jgi:hypothetical protein